MKAVCTSELFRGLGGLCRHARHGSSRLLQASHYDYVVHVKNIHEIGYNPEVSEDRKSMARARQKVLRRTRVVGEQKIITEIYGITSSKPDYVVFVSCGAGLKAKK